MKSERCETEIKIRITMPKEAFCERKELITKVWEIQRDETKMEIVMTLLWPTLLYVPNTRILRNEDIRKLKYFEKWL